MNTKFILKTGEFIYPAYLDKTHRLELKNKFGNGYGYMRCGCRPDENLFYRISEDGKIYPEHNNYQHNKSCIRYKTPDGKKLRTSGYIIDDETGDVTAYLNFNPKTFNIAEDKEEKDQDNIVPPEIEEDENIEQIIIEKEEQEQEKVADDTKEKNLNLEEFIRNINIDAFDEKVLNNILIKSKQEFSRYVYGRTHRVHISSMKRNLAELTLEKDGVKFIYLPVAGIDVQDLGTIKKCSVLTYGSDGHTYSNFINEKTLNTALNKFKKQYKTDSLNDVMIAGFQYLKKVNKAGKKYSYRVFGRIHFFKTSDIGLYCRSSKEQEIFNKLDEIKKAHSDINYWIPTEDDIVGAIISKAGESKKLLLFFKSSKVMPVYMDMSLYTPILIKNAEELNYKSLSAVF